MTACGPEDECCTDTVSYVRRFVLTDVNLIQFDELRQTSLVSWNVRSALIPISPSATLETFRSFFLRSRECDMGNPLTFIAKMPTEHLSANYLLIKLSIFSRYTVL